MLKAIISSLFALFIVLFTANAATLYTVDNTNCGAEVIAKDIYSQELACEDCEFEPRFTNVYQTTEGTCFAKTREVKYSSGLGPFHDSRQTVIEKSRQPVRVEWEENTIEDRKDGFTYQPTCYNCEGKKEVKVSFISKCFSSIKAIFY